MSVGACGKFDGQTYNGIGVCPMQDTKSLKAKIDPEEVLLEGLLYLQRQMQRAGLVPRFVVSCDKPQTESADAPEQPVSKP